MYVASIVHITTFFARIFFESKPKTPLESPDVKIACLLWPASFGLPALGRTDAGGPERVGLGLVPGPATQSCLATFLRRPTRGSIILQAHAETVQFSRSGLGAARDRGRAGGYGGCGDLQHDGALRP